jgi:hypothetical protein
MKIRHFFAAMLLVVTAPSMAVPIEERFDLGSLSVPSVSILGNTFFAAGDYDDIYTFSISQEATAGGLVFELDPWRNGLDINVTSVSLTGNSGLIGFDSSAFSYNFGSLATGSYTLGISSTVSSTARRNPGSVGYVGLLGLGRARPASVPEPGTLALFGVGLLGIAITARRKTVRS